MKIVRKPTRAEGGITEDEKIKLKAVSEKWIKNSFYTQSTHPLSKEERHKIIKENVIKLYASAGLKEPKIVIVPSPLVMAFSFGMASVWWYLKEKLNATYDATRTATRDATDSETSAAMYAATDSATYDATRTATRDATDSATYDATRTATESATSDATYDATYDATKSATRTATDSATRTATYDATDSATSAATDSATYDATRTATESATSAATYDATRDATRTATGYKWILNMSKYFCGGYFKAALESTKLWYRPYQGGNMWSGFLSYADGMRNVINLTGLNCWEKYSAYEKLGYVSGFRILHEKFCMVCDIPEEYNVIKNGERYQLHKDGGPAIKWGDGFSIWALHGINVSKEIAETPSEKLDPKIALTEKNTDVQREVIRKIGYDRMLKACNAKIIEDWMCPKTGLKYTMRHMKIGEIDRRYLCYEHASMPGIFYAKCSPPEVTNCLEMRVFQTCENPEQMRVDLSNKKYTVNQLVSMLPETVQ